MATYGTKKRGIFGKFSGFQAGKSKTSVEKASGYSRLGKVKSGMKCPWNRPGKESVDERANDTLLGGLSYSSERSISSELDVQPRASSISTIPPGLTRFQSSLTLAEAVDVPVPPAPITTMSSNPDHHRSLPTRNLMLKLRRKGNKEHVRPVVSAPILQGADPRIRTRPIISAPISRVPSLSPAGMLHDDDGAPPQDVTTPQISTADAESINQKIDMLLNNQLQALQAAEDPEAIENVNTGRMSRRSPLQRGKAALAKATRAIGVRRNSNNCNGLGKQAVHELEGTPPSSSPHNLPKSGSNDNDDSPTRIDLRKAEGTNLAKMKVQAFMGDGYIKRKPLPGAEKRRSPTPELEDPLADAKLDAILALGTPGFSGFNFNFNFEPNGAQHDSSHDPSSSQSCSGTSMSIAAGGRRPYSKSCSTSSNSLSYLKYSTETESFSSSPVEFSTPLESSSPFSYCDTVSGLTQHPDVLTIATSPVVVSPPRVRLKLNHTLNRQKRSRAVLRRDSFIPNIDFENAIEDDAPFVATHSGSSSHRSISIKRKNAMVELRHNCSTLKRTKRDSIVSNHLREEEEAGLVTDIGRLDTEDRQALLPKYQNAEIRPRDKDSINPKGAPKRGLAMFDTGKGKESMMSEEDERPRLPLRRAVYKRSAIPRPTADFYSSRMRVCEDTKVNNPMDIDKLQTSERAYYAGRK
ncbi:hypothetical protein MMC29_005825 [Sticta canariensis]|nr:hypothetical protein [Sticta canariensis]